jgi:translation initiation factor IF-2
MTLAFAEGLRSNAYELPLLCFCDKIRVVMAKTTTQPKLANAAKTAARVSRPPVVVIVGHVDHGKTTLLDYIRKTNVADREAGGITQAVGAYEIAHNGRTMTFIDTPGHEAFGAMRTRGAQAADLAILVVSAEEGMKPQTKEALKILEDTVTPFVVAFTKIDRTNGNIDKPRNDLMAAGVLFEGFGGQVSFHGVSGKTGEGVGELLDMLLLMADVEDFSYDPAAGAKGFVLEARRDPRRGVETTLIIKDGTLKRGDPIATPTASGKVKILENFFGKTVDELVPSAPAVVVGFESLPQIGEAFAAGEGTTNHEPRTTKEKEKRSMPEARNMGSRGGDLPLILKASDAGSLEALAVVLRGIDHAEEKGLRIIAASVGDITDGDVKLATTTGASIIGFKCRVEKAAQGFGEAQGVRIITSKIVYDLEKAVNDFLTEQWSPIAGEVEVLALFNQTKMHKQLVGGRVTRGTFRAHAACEILRQAGPEVPHMPLGSGKIISLHEKKTEITSAENGKEIGVVVGSSVLIQIGDRLVIKK